MRLRATTQIRNAHMLSAMEERGWCQADVARAAGVQASAIGLLVKFRFTRVGQVTIEKIAKALGLEADLVGPPELRGLDLQTRFEQEAIVPISALLAAVEAPEALYLGSHEEQVDNAEEVERGMADLTERERMCLRMRYGLDGQGERTLREVGETMGVSIERTRQIECRAARKMREALDVSTGARSSEKADPACVERRVWESDKKL